jgi:hypothetical protein
MVWVETEGIVSIGEKAWVTRVHPNGVPERTKRKNWQKTASGCKKRLFRGRASTRCSRPFSNQLDPASWGYDNSEDDCLQLIG